ncbi:hypothetical protein D5b_00016 [Faustovirus]|nr:hypothetical protein D5b_00016 [Faustovirus]AMN84893.1 hypothetical protein D6_00494 [Faustovirus]AMP43976.1 hypothetical protein PRJ_Dakar_00016 [Faustovirus]
MFFGDVKLNDAVIDINDFIDLAPSEADEDIIVNADEDEIVNAVNSVDNDNVDNDNVDKDLNESLSVLDDFVNIEADLDVAKSGKCMQLYEFVKLAGGAMFKILLSGAKTLKDVADLVYNIGYTTYCVAYTSVKVVVVVSEIVLITGKIIYFTIKTTVQTTNMCYRMLME